MSARQKYNGGAQVHSIVVTLAHMGPLVAFAAHTMKLVMPAKAKVIGVDFNVGTKGGTFSTATLDVQKGGVTILGAAFNVATAVAGTPISKEVADLAAGADPVAGDSAISLVTAESGGTSPTWSDALVQIDYILQ